MTTGLEHLTEQTFGFLKQALGTDEPGFMSLRGPHNFIQGDWTYTYTQDGDITDFSGLEQIYHQGNLVFFHRAIGGILAK